METLLYWLARGLVWLFQSLPLGTVARLGRAAGAIAFWLDGRHRRVARKNLTACFGQEMAPHEIESIARENFRRLGESYVCAIKTATMSWNELAPHVECEAPPALSLPKSEEKPRSVVVAIGHFGNFELYARFGDFNPAYQCATTYRALRQPRINELMQSLRERSGCLFFERRFDATALKALMKNRGIMLGLLADQHAGQGGLRLPFIGRDCSTSVAPAVFALRYDCALHTAICYRVGLARWRVVVEPEIPTHEAGRARSTEELMRDINKSFEAAVRRDPANWFWVHNRWKPAKHSEAAPEQPVPRQLGTTKNSPAA